MWHSDRNWMIVLAAALGQLAVAAVILPISEAFAYDRPLRERPIVPVVALLIGASVLQLGGLAAALRLPPGRRLAWLIFGVAIVLRGLWCATEPIQEVDAYRYLWDGAAVVSGVSPYAYTPARVRTADPARETLSEPLRRLVRMRDADPAMRTILQRVHFPALRTIYPPVSQAVFAAAVRVVPRGTGVRARLIVLKTVIVAFDLACMFVLWGLLCHVGMHPGWTVLWAWSPLVLKEFAGSGHHDVIAVFFLLCGLAVSCAEPFARWNPVARGTLAGTLLGLGIGAKLFPAVVVPLLAVAACRRAGWREAVAVVNAAVFVGAALLVPMWAASARRPADAEPVARQIVSDTPPVPGQTESAGSGASAGASEELLLQRPQPAPDSVRVGSAPAGTSSWQDDGLWAFLRHWEINDWAFRVLAENLGTGSPARKQAWYCALPQNWRQQVAASMAAWWGVPQERAGFVAARIGTVLLSGVIVLAWSLRLYSDPRVETLLAACGTSLAWFWFLLPTQNPWYWSWALIVLPFVPNRGWLLTAPLVLLYYLRFWFAYQFPDQPVWGTPYRGAEFFDHVVVWCEHVPVLLAVTLGAVTDRRWWFVPGDSSGCKR